MLENFIFENHLGQRFVGLDNDTFMNSNDLRDYSWKYDTINNKISRFYKGTGNKTLPLIVYCKSDEEAISVKNRLHELAEVDIEAKIPGRVFVGDYYTKGYITGSTKTNYLISKRLCDISLTLTSEDPSWYRDQRYVFFPGEDSSTAIGGTDHPYDYKYDYALALSGRQIVCDTLGSNAFRLLIYGEVTNPAVVIGGHTYAVNGTIGAGESLLIDSVDKTITLTTTSGTKSNWFDKRARDNYIFQPIPPGQSTVSWSGTFGFDLTVVEKRSEPKWT